MRRTSQMRSVAKLIGPARLRGIEQRRADRADRRRSERLVRASDAPEVAKSRWRATAPGPELTWARS